MGHNVEVIKIVPHLGAEIRGVDLRAALSQDAFNAVHDAFVENQVIVLHGQKIKTEQLIAFGNRFGELSVHPFSPNQEDTPELIIFDNNEDNHRSVPTAGIRTKPSAPSRPWAPCCRPR